VLAEMVEALATPGYGSTPVLRPRSITDGLRRAVRQGPVSQRREP